jgi:hypothetical protein
MFVGYPQNHSDNIYHLFKCQKRQVIKFRVLTWLEKDYESVFDDPIGDNDFDITTNNLIFKETDLQHNHVPSR